MRSTLLYLSLVGLPLLALAGILRAGERLVPPVSVGGPWRVAGHFAALDSNSCLGVALATGQRTLVVSQSGSYLSAALGAAAESRFEGRLTGDVIDLAVRAVKIDPQLTRGCHESGGARIVARLDRSRVVPRLVGTITEPACAGCPPLAFTATPQRRHAALPRH